jgi:glycosyltransferase involved in cell wall biosynthesis
MTRRYVTAFPGRRDQYQVPLALADNDRLERFTTCFYQGRGILGRIPPLEARLGHRFSMGIPEDSVNCMEFTNLWARIGSRVLQPSRVGMWEDMAFARRAVAVARDTKASLFLYEFQADWAFRQPMDHRPVRVLFQFHTHPDMEHPLLCSDGKRYPNLMEQVLADTRSNLPEAYRMHTREAWRHADHVIVASNHTAASLRFAGCPAQRISVVPYGVDLAVNRAIPPDEASPNERPYFLFVGSGIHRKGLHHLLEAWGRSELGRSLDLVVIARVLEPEMERLIGQAQSVRLIPGVTREQLNRWYRSARAFVMPSLSEGFGHVYLEALANGCPVIGTRNTMLPDFAEAQGNIRYSEPCNPEDLRAVMESVALLPQSDSFFDTTATRRAVGQYTWARFRHGIEAVLRRFDS